MKYTSIIGALLIAIAVVSTFIGKIKLGEIISEPEFPLGLMYGVGLGLLVGGFLGWLYKKPHSNSHEKKSNNHQD